MEVCVLARSSTGEFQEDSHRRVRILAAEQPCTIGRELAFPEPLQECQLDWQQGEPGEKREILKPEGQQEDQHGPVERVAAHHVSQFVRDEDPRFVFVRAGEPHPSSER